MGVKTIEDVDVAGKRVLIRADLNVPLTADGDVADTPQADRIRIAAEAVRGVTQRGGRAIVVSHLGRPAGRGAESGLTLAPCAKRLGELLGAEVGFAADCVGSEAESRASALGDGEALVLENLRFHREEQANDPGFAKALAGLADVYCNEAFPTVFRRHASLVGVPEAMGEAPRVVGPRLKKELEQLADLYETPAEPFVAVAGGLETADRFRALQRLLPAIDVLLTGGGLAHVLMSAAGRSVGESPIERSAVERGRELLAEADRHETRLFLPEDHVVGRDMSSETETDVVEEQIGRGWRGLDIGPQTVNRYSSFVRGADTVFWSGPMGAFETEPFEVGTREIASAVAERVELGAQSYVAGGHTGMAVHKLELGEHVGHISSGRDASLKYLAGDAFEGLDLLERN